VLDSPSRATNPVGTSEVDRLQLLDVEGDAPGCLLGALVGGLVSAFAEPLLYLLGIPEETTELLGFLFLPIAPAVNATIGFNWSGADPG